MTTTNLYALPDSVPQDLEQLKSMCDQFTREEITAARFQAFRVPQGIYEQREPGTYMIRCRLPAGQVTPEQMRLAARISREYGSGVLHLTSRQDLQVHAVALEGIYPATVALTNGGLSPKGGGGNTVRNIAACPFAGVCPDEVFDVTPHLIALTEALLNDPLSYQLPRKYKIAYSGCGTDCAGATVNDLGLIAKQRDGIDGFAVYVGGGMGSFSRVAQGLEEFVPAKDVYRVAEAVKRVFDKHGNRKNRHRARIRFLIESLGFEEFQKLYRAELTGIAKMLAPVSVAHEAPRRTYQTAVAAAPGFAQWQAVHAAPQKQAGYFTVDIGTPAGVLDANLLDSLADLVQRFGDGIARATAWQTLMLRWVAEDDLPALHAGLAAIGLGQPRPPILRRMVTCAGASTCRLGICRSRGVAAAIQQAIGESDLDLTGPIGDASIHISGCTNSCGRHPVAPIGLFGVARREHGRPIPAYVVQLGGHVEEGKSTLATGAYTLPAKNVPAFVVDLLRAAQDEGADLDTFLANGGREIAAALAKRHEVAPSFDDDPSAYIDWDAQEPFSLAGRGAAECGAGVFDLIDIDLAEATNSLAAGRQLLAVGSAARALLITRSKQADSDKEGVELFLKLFVDEGLVPASVRPLLESAQRAYTEPVPEAAFLAEPDDVAAFVEAVKALYKSLGPSLRVTPA
ncbi:MAG: nitrite/sulfite reductase [Capsulimonadaceae bacterium]|nr:nitrite/sulfite reductase [Capsulimonadaceae bacterium]